MEENMKECIKTLKLGVMVEALEKNAMERIKIAMINQNLLDILSSYMDFFNKESEK